MAQVWFISDLHFGHYKLMQFAGDYRHGNDYLENMQSIVDMWNMVVREKDKIYVLGDVVFYSEHFDILDELNGRKILVRGNHDDNFETKEWLKFFDSVEIITGNNAQVGLTSISPCISY